MGIQVSTFKAYQITMDLKRLGLLNSLKGQSSRILNVDKKIISKWNMKLTILRFGHTLYKHSKTWGIKPVSDSHRGSS